MLNTNRVSVGVAVALSCVLALSMAQQHVAAPLRVEYMPHPKQMVQIENGGPYTVPAGSLFVLTALGTQTLNYTHCILFVNGTPRIAHDSYALGGPFTVSQAPIGLTVPAGSVLTMANTGGVPGGCAWGYLVDG